MSTKPTSDQERIDTREQRARSEAFEAIVPTEGVVNVTNHSHAKPSTSSVFVDLFDGEAVSCSCPDWEHRAPEGGCKHIRFVNSKDALLLAARMPTGNRGNAQ